MFKKNHKIIKNFLAWARQDQPRRFTDAQWDAYAADMDEDFKHTDLSVGYAKPTRDITVVGRNGAGKSTFVDNFRSSPLFGSLYEIDSDRLNKISRKYGFIHEQDLGDLVLEFLDRLDIPVINTSASVVSDGKFGRHLGNKGSNAVSVMHVFLCAGPVAVGRVEKRMAAGEHPDVMRDSVYLSQHPFILGLGEFIDKAQRLVVWNSSSEGDIFPLLTSDKNKILIHDADKLAVFGHDEKTLRMLLYISREYPLAAKRLLDMCTVEQRFVKRNEPQSWITSFHNEVFQPGLFFDALARMNTLFGGAVICSAASAMCRSVWEGKMAAPDIDIRYAAESEKLPPLNVLLPWQEQADIVAKYHDFFAKPGTKPARPAPRKSARSRRIPSPSYDGPICLDFRSSELTSAGMP